MSILSARFPSDVMYVVREYATHPDHGFANMCVVASKVEAEALALRFAELARKAAPLREQMFQHIKSWCDHQPGRPTWGCSKEVNDSWSVRHNAEPNAWLDRQGITDPDLRAFVLSYAKHETFTYDVAPIPRRAA